MASATISSSSMTKSRIRPAAVSERGFGAPSALQFAVVTRGIARFAGFTGEWRASGRNQGAKFGFVGFAKRLRKQVREALRRTLRQGAVRGGLDAGMVSGEQGGQPGRLRRSDPDVARRPAAGERGEGGVGPRS